MPDPFPHIRVMVKVGGFRLVDHIKTPCLIVTTCTNRKRGYVPSHLRASSLEMGDLAGVAQQWVSQLNASPKSGVARDVYCGRGFKEAMAARTLTGRPLHIISAGLGLVTEDTEIPCYELTVAGCGPESVSSKVVGGYFSRSNWWSTITTLLGNPNPLARLIREYSDSLILIALSSTYAELISEEMATLSERELSRVRFFGLSISEKIEKIFRPLVMPYDERLDGPDSKIPGTRSDFSSRAILHFVREVLSDELATPEGHKQAVLATLAGMRTPQTIKRRRCTEEEIRCILQHYIVNDHCKTIASSLMLRILRDELMISCEQGRFAKIFNSVKKS